MVDVWELGMFYNNCIVKDASGPPFSHRREELLDMQTIKPPIATYHLTLVASCAILFIAWEVVDHTWLMHLPMDINHGLDALATLVIVVLLSAAVFNLVGRYQRAIAKLNMELADANTALSRLEADRDERLLDLARDLSFEVAGLVGESEVALQTTTDLRNIKAFADAIDRAGKIEAIAHELLDLKQMSSTVVGTESVGHEA
jgi:signal transduction histidine kinase